MFLGKDIEPRMANRLVAELLYLEALDPGKPITMYVNSPGGQITAGFAIFDVMRSLKSPITTIATGLVASMATIILAGGTKGSRFSYPNTRILIHQPLGGVRGQATDVEIHAREILATKAHLNGLLAEMTGQALKKIEKDTNRDFWMSAAEAKDYGIVDGLV